MMFIKKYERKTVHSIKFCMLLCIIYEIFFINLYVDPAKDNIDTLGEFFHMITSVSIGILPFILWLGILLVINLFYILSLLCAVISGKRYETNILQIEKIYKLDKRLDADYRFVIQHVDFEAKTSVRYRIDKDGFEKNIPI
ncbi:MAG: hypothetical protein Q4D76_19240 [Oscillospiraceae bacterium]|nr:hypothetical protein [Oscillospiraceae bacterium]